MSEAAGTLIDTILERIRDDIGVGTSRTLTRTTLSSAQRFVNAWLRNVLDTVTLTTYPHQQLYATTAGGLEGLIRIEGVRDGDRNLTRIPDWRELAHISTSWFRDVSDQHEAWSLIGRGVLVLYPAKVQQSTVDVIGSKLTDALTTEAMVTDITDDRLRTLLDLTEAVLTLRGRNLPLAASKIQEFMRAMGVPGGQG